MAADPDVTMLWESVDPLDALRRRFGFRDGAAVRTWVGEALRSWWAIDIDHCDRLVISGWNAMAWVTDGERRLIAKWSAVPPKFQRLRDAAAITTFVHERGVPVAAPIPATDGRLLVELKNDARGRARALLPLPGSRFLLGVLPVVDGELLDVTDAVQLREAGHMLATLHESLAAYPHRLQRKKQGEDQQLVHNDFRSSNILHDGRRISAVLDFEEITYDTRVADVAKSTVYLGTRYRDWGPMTRDEREAFVASYTACAPLAAAERRELDRRIAAGLDERGWS